MMLKYLAGWFGLLIIAVINGSIRDFIYKPYVGELAAHQISTLVLAILIGAYVWLLEKRISPVSTIQDWLIGFCWLAMTVSFEFLFFHFVRGIPWQLLLLDYNIMEGRIWIFVLIWTALAPRIIWQIRNKLLRPSGKGEQNG